MRETTTRTKAVMESSRELIEQLAWEEQRLSKPAVRKAFLPITLREGMSVCWEIADVEPPLNDYCTTGPAARSTIVAPPDMPA